MRNCTIGAGELRATFLAIKHCQQTKFGKVIQLAQRSLKSWGHIFCARRGKAFKNNLELFSSNRGVSHLNEACRIDELSRVSVLGYEILTNDLRSKCTVVAS